MTLPDSPDLIYCQTCAVPWQKTDTRTMYHFAPVLGDDHNTSPAQIVAADVPMTFCPSCNVDVLAEASEALTSGDHKVDPLHLDHERASKGDADVVHKDKGRRA